MIHLLVPLFPSIHDLSVITDIVCVYVACGRVYSRFNLLRDTAADLVARFEMIVM